MPEYEGTECYHFEYLHFDPDDAETGFSNRVEVISDSAIAGWTAHRLSTDPKVWALHIRRYPQPEQDVHLYAESQPLAKAQNEAYAQRKRADTLQKLLTAAVMQYGSMEAEYEREIAGLERNVSAYKITLDRLVHRLEIVKHLARKDQSSVVHMDPAEVIAKIGEIDISGMLNEARKKLVLKSRAHAGQEAAPEDGVYYGDEDGMGHSLAAPQEPAEARVCTKCGKDDAVLCVCGHPRERHVDEGPEHGCHDCARDEYDHAFKAPEPESADMALPEDECSCGHPRKDHNEYACRICVVDHTHEFKLAVL
jgi:hypothetical protein